MESNAWEAALKTCSCITLFLLQWNLNKVILDHWFCRLMCEKEGENKVDRNGEWLLTTLGIEWKHIHLAARNLYLYVAEFVPNIICSEVSKSTAGTLTLKCSQILKYPSIKLETNPDTYWHQKDDFWLTSSIWS